ncbi:MAG: hypothetical protein HC815_34935 [Richelia sp. RM1_1_1]|nr:hypothetical protein [Richelia sp. RM1_1_1]
MKYNSRIADSASALNNSASKIFVDDAWMFDESRDTANKDFQKPTLWVSDPATIGKLATLFNVLPLGDTSDFPEGDHYIIAERWTKEESIKACAWRLKSVGKPCKVYSVQTSLECLIAEQSMTIQETVLQILDYAQTFDDWSSRIDYQPLTIKIATNIARSAIAILSKSEKAVELATLRQRCNEAPYNWNQLIKTLEAERKATRDRNEQHLKRSFSLEDVPEAPFGKDSKQLIKRRLIEQKWGDRLKFNEMLQRLELDGEHLMLDTIKTEIAVQFNMDIGREDAIDILLHLAKQRSYHPVRDYLNQVADSHPDIDTSILDNIATRYFGNDSAIANIYMRKTLIGAVARIMEPGCKMDTITILYGKQGTYKSTFWRRLIGNEFFTDSLVDLTHKDELAKLRRFWGLELAEIDYLFGQKAVESFKRFLSAQDDTYRPPYGRENVTVNRTCFFVGTTNKKDLLNDPTGDRRYWVLDVLTDFIPYKLLDTERDLIWAAAVKLYRQGERWDLTEQEKTLSYGSNEEYHSQDPWEDAIARYINIHYKVTTQEILTDALKFEINQCDLLKQRRVVAILQRLGCESKTVSRNGKKFRAWVYTPPSPESNADVTAYAVDVTPTVTTQIQSQQTSELTVTPVTPKVENFSENLENESPVDFGDSIETDVTDVTEYDSNSPNSCDESVLDGNASVEFEEEITVLPEVTALPPSEWMSEENLQAIAADLEWCVSIEQFQVFMNIYNFEALMVAASRTEASKQEQIKLWMNQLDALK